jgi:1,4-dihydroxy-2-naphthoate octaprenyltransferase
MCVALGVAAAWSVNGSIDSMDATLVLLGALLAHMSVNLLNEYEDFTSGLDNMTDRTPFSGGSGTLPANPNLANAVRWAGVATGAGCALVGIYFVVQHGSALLPLGLLGVLVVFVYSPWITREWISCLVAPGLGFGPLMVVGTALVLGGEYTAIALLVSFTPFFLVSGLLLLNQFPDVEPDRKVGRRHLPILLGRPRAAWVFNGFLFAAFVPIIVGLANGMLPATAALGLLPLLAAPVLAYQVANKADNLPALVPFMGLNVGIVLVTPLLLAVGLLIA